MPEQVSSSVGWRRLDAPSIHLIVPRSYIVRKGGRAYIEGPQRAPKGDTLRRAGPKGAIRMWPIYAARWDWMGEISIECWKEIWQRQAKWEEMGGTYILVGGDGMVADRGTARRECL
jgi:hypothetical protein